MLINSYNYKYKRKETMVNITQEGEELLGYNPLKEYPLFGHKKITINGNEYVIRKCYVLNNKIHLKLFNKNTQEIEEFSVVQLTNDLTTQNKPNSITLYNSIKTFINKYIKKPNKK